MWPNQDFAVLDLMTDVMFSWVRSVTDKKLLGHGGNEWNEPQKHDTAETQSWIMFCMLTAFHLGSHWLYP